LLKRNASKKRRNVVSGIGDIITKPGNIYYDPPVIENVVRSLRRALWNRNYDIGNFTYCG
jgi:cell division GTPase FtsZ